MKVSKCIEILDIAKPNHYSTEEKYRWLSFIERTIIEEILKTHEDYDDDYDDFEDYSDETSDDDLIAPAPYDELYVQFLKMKIDEENGETAKYNNSASLFNNYYQAFEKAYNKDHLPIYKNHIITIPYRGRK